MCSRLAVRMRRARGRGPHLRRPCPARHVLQHLWGQVLPRMQSRARAAAQAGEALAAGGAASIPALGAALRGIARGLDAEGAPGPLGRRPFAARAGTRLALLARALALEPPRVLSQLGALQARRGPAPCRLPHPDAAPCACLPGRPSDLGGCAVWGSAAPCWHDPNPDSQRLQDAVGTHRVAAASIAAQLVGNNGAKLDRAVAALGVVPAAMALALARPACNALHCACLRLLRRAASGGRPAGRAPACRGRGAPLVAAGGSGKCGGARVGGPTCGVLHAAALLCMLVWISVTGRRLGASS